MDFAPYFQAIAEETDSDLYLFRAPITTHNADLFIDNIRFHVERRPNCILVLTTGGGSPDAGYRMVRVIKRYYKKFTLLLYGMCKSTGTLIALGADEIAMGDFAELGPLDIQLAKEDEVFSTSGLSYAQSLLSLREQISQHFYDHFMTLKRGSGLNLTTRTAAEVASKLAVGLLSPISSQLDPVKLGEVYRAITIADDYGTRLCKDKDRTTRLITGYPSHSFVIDIEEAKEIFGDIVRPLSENELALESVLLSQVRHEFTPLVIDLTKTYLQHNVEVDEDEHNAPIEASLNDLTPDDSDGTSEQ